MDEDLVSQVKCVLGLKYKLIIIIALRCADLLAAWPRAQWPRTCMCLGQGLPGSGTHTGSLRGMRKPAGSDLDQ